MFGLLVGAQHDAPRAPHAVPLQFPYGAYGRRRAVHSPPYFRMGQSSRSYFFAPRALRSLSISLLSFPFAMLRAVQPYWCFRLTSAPFSKSSLTISE
jgi:hypothetical protein